LELYKDYVVLIRRFEALDIKDSEEFYFDINSDDFFVDLNRDCKDLYQKIDASIRMKLRSRGLTVYRTVYSGFDTEYNNINIDSNELVSVQLAVSFRLIIKIPIQISYVMGSVNTLKDEFYKSDATLIKRVEFKRIEDDINIIIGEIRSVKYADYDYSISFLHKVFSEMGFKKVVNVDKGCVYYITNASPIKG
jgi:hypothetical protein